jgi:hypothetical protein
MAADRATWHPVGLRLWAMAEEPPRPSTRGSKASATSPGPAATGRGRSCRPRRPGWPGRWPGRRGAALSVPWHDGQGQVQAGGQAFGDGEPLPSSPASEPVAPPNCRRRAAVVSASNRARAASTPCSQPATFSPKVIGRAACSRVRPSIGVAAWVRPGSPAPRPGARPRRGSARRRPWPAASGRCRPGPGWWRPCGPRRRRVAVPGGDALAQDLDQRDGQGSGVGGGFGQVLDVRQLDAGGGDRLAGRQRDQAFATWASARAASNSRAARSRAVVAEHRQHGWRRRGAVAKEGGQGRGLLGLPSDVEEDGFARALQDDVEAPGVVDLAGDQGVAALGGTRARIGSPALAAWSSK